MKVIAVLFSMLAVATAFAPAGQGRANTQLSETLFDKIFNMDLFEPVKEQNDYGARYKKKIASGKIGSNSYVPAGLTAAQYQKIRDSDDAKKKANYDRNVKKAGLFEDFTAFYTKRGTDTAQAWAKSATRGHRMAKLKYEIDSSNQKKYDGSA